MPMTNLRGAKKPRVLLLGPQRDAVSGVSTHLNQLFGSGLGNEFELGHFQVGSEGRQESRFQTLARLIVSPFLLAARILRDRPAIVHINASLDHKSFPRDATYLAVAKSLRRRVIFQIHGGLLPADYQPNSALLTRLVARVLRSADIVVLLAKSELEAYSAFVPEARLQIIPNAIDIDVPSGMADKEFSGPLRLTYVGRLTPTKGVADCLAAAHLLNKAGRDFTLTIGGSGPQEDELQQQAGALIENGTVRLIGPVHGAAKTRVWRDSHIFVFPTGHLEGLPYSLLEAMSAGTVPITTRVGAIPDVMEDGIHGLFVPPADPHALYDAIVRLDDDRQLLSTMSRNCERRIVDEYTVNRLYSDFRDVYRSLTPSTTVDSSTRRRRN